MSDTATVPPHIRAILDNLKTRSLTEAEISIVSAWRREVMPEYDTSHYKEVSEEEYFNRDSWPNGLPVRTEAIDNKPHYYVDFTMQGPIEKGRV